MTVGFFFLKVLVVPRDSVTKLASHSMIVKANHIDICKPVTKGDSGYQKLLEILEMILVPDMSTSAMKQSAGSTAAKSSIKSENLSRTILQFHFRKLIHYISNKKHNIVYSLSQAAGLG
jgi:hypothetical protein